jgi:hypothetical protein
VLLPDSPLPAPWLPPAPRLLEHLLTTLYPVGHQIPAASTNAAGSRAGGAARSKAATALAIDPRAREALMCHDLHAALLNCALEVVAHISEGHSASRAFPWATQQAGRARATLSLWDAIRSAGRLVGASGVACCLAQGLWAGAGAGASGDAELHRALRPCCRWFKSCFSESSCAPAPASVVANLDAISCRIEDQLALARGSNAFDVVVTGGLGG